MTVQAPQVPRSQTFLQPVTSRWLRSASSKVTRGSTLVCMLRPLTLRVTLIAPGPCAGTLAAAASWAFAVGAAALPARAVVAARVVEPCRKSRRDNPGLTDVSLESLMLLSFGDAS